MPQTGTIRKGVKKGRQKGLAHRLTGKVIRGLIKIRRIDKKARDFRRTR